MLFKKKEKKMADTMFFDEFKKILKNGRKDIEKIKKDMSDIDEGYKILTKKYDTEKVFFGLLMREEEEILEMIFRTLRYCQNKNISIPNEFYNTLESNRFMYDRYMEFMGDVFGLINIDETARLGYLELEVLLYREIFFAEKKRLQYIRELAKRKGVQIETIEVKNMLYALDLFYCKGIQDNPNQDKLQLICTILNTMPNDTFNKCGLSPIQLYR